MQNSTDQAPVDSHSSWRRDVVFYLLAAVLIAWCIRVFLPRTIAQRTTELIPITIKFVVTAGLRGVCRLLHASPGDLPLMLQIFSFLVLFTVIRRYRIGGLIKSGGNVRLLLLALLSFPVLIAFDALTSTAVMYAYVELANYVLLVTFILLLAILGNQYWWRFLATVIGCCVVLQSLYAIGNYWTGKAVYTSPGIGHRAVGTFQTPNTLFPICMMAALFFIALALNEDNKWRGRAYVLCAAITGMAMILTFSRAAGIGLAAGLIFLGLAENRRRGPIILGAMGLIVMMVMVLARAAPKQTGVVGTDRSAMGRVYIWRTAMRIIGDNWLIGVGHYGYRDKQWEYAGEKLKQFRPTNIDAKNQYLTMAADHGLVGMMVMGFFIYAVWTACRWCKEGRPSDWEPRMQQGIRLAGIAILAASLVDTPLFSYQRFQGTMMWLLCVGFLLNTHIRSSAAYRQQVSSEIGTSLSPSLPTRSYGGG